MNTYIARLSDISLFSFVHNLTHIAMEPATNCVHPCQNVFFFSVRVIPEQFMFVDYVVTLRFPLINKIYFQYKYHVTRIISFLLKPNEIFM